MKLIQQITGNVKDTLFTKSQLYTDNVVLFIAVVQIAQNSIQSILFSKTYDPSSA